MTSENSDSYESAIPRRARVAWMFAKMYPVTAIGLPLWAVILAAAFQTRAWWMIAAYSIVYGVAGIAENERERKHGWGAHE